MCFFSQRLFLKEPTKQDEIQDVSEVCGLGLCAVYVGYFPFPRFYGYIELTPYIFMYIFSFLLVPGWHLECPHHLFFQNLPVQKVRYSKQKVCQNYLYIYIYIHSCLFIETHCSQELLDIIYIYIYIYIYISIYLSICVYVWMQVSYIENLQGLPKAPAKQDSEALKSAKKEANTVEDSADDMWWTLLLVSATILQTQGKQKTQKTQETHIIHT